MADPPTDLLHRIAGVDGLGRRRMTQAVPARDGVARRIDYLAVLVFDVQEREGRSTFRFPAAGRSWHEHMFVNPIAERVRGEGLFCVRSKRLS